MTSVRRRGNRKVRGSHIPGVRSRARAPPAPARALLSEASASHVVILLETHIEFGLEVQRKTSEALERSFGAENSLLSG